ncbi:unnamed protein product [marine sediment metagenome]|uniref:Uncharacterized protein n=1 Tax=marine sediment metagenome TaxID=412755 RepID=X1V3R2_9ZZZZ
MTGIGWNYENISEFFLSKTLLAIFYRKSYNNYTFFMFNDVP